MSHHIPFDIQSKIIKRLPVKSLIQLRSVSKQWESFIDNPKFIRNYHINHTNPQHHLLVDKYELDNVQTYTFIIDNDTFPQQKFPLTAPESIRLLRCPSILSCVDGLLYFCGHVDHGTKMAVIWNPSVRKSVSIVIPVPKAGYIVMGFGVCPYTSDPKLVKINLNKISNSWVVEVFTLNTRVWKIVYTGAPFRSCDPFLDQACIDGVIYFLAFFDDVFLDRRSRSNLVISFQLKSEKFGEVCLPERFVHTCDLYVKKLNESLGLLEYYNEGGMKVCGVWSRIDGAKIYTIKVDQVKWLAEWVLGFRNNGEVVMELDNDKESRIAVYEPLSGHINDVGINGKLRTFYAWSYMETLLLLNESDSTIH